MVEFEEVRYIVFIVKKERDINVSVQFDFFIFKQFRVLVQGMVLFREDRLFYFNNFN